MNAAEGFTSSSPSAARLSWRRNGSCLKRMETDAWLASMTMCEANGAVAASLYGKICAPRASVWARYETPESMLVKKRYGEGTVQSAKSRSRSISAANSVIQRLNMLFVCKVNPSSSKKSGLNLKYDAFMSANVDASTIEETCFLRES